MYSVTLGNLLLSLFQCHGQLVQITSHTWSRKSQLISGSHALLVRRITSTQSLSWFKRISRVLVVKISSYDPPESVATFPEQYLEGVALLHEKESPARILTPAMCLSMVWIADALHELL
jgi:hypothetical protein